MSAYPEIHGQALYQLSYIPYSSLGLSIPSGHVWVSALLYEDPPYEDSVVWLQSFGMIGIAATVGFWPVLVGELFMWLMPSLFHV